LPSVANGPFLPLPMVSDAAMRLFRTRLSLHLHD